jgi:hypothetical protein
MSCIPDPAIGAHLRADVQNFVGTRWTWVQPVVVNGGAFYNEHVVQCTLVEGGFAHLSTVFSDPFHHLVAEVSEFFSSTGAFTYIGKVKDFAWVSSGAYFEHHFTLYRIDGIEGKYIRCTPEWRMIEEASLRSPLGMGGPLNVRPGDVNLIYEGQYLSRMTPVGLETMHVLIQELVARAERNNVGVAPMAASPEEPKPDVVGAERYDRVEPV